jgi:hypothetical protein
MAMFIEFKGLTQELHIPGDKPIGAISDVISVQADGDELVAVLDGIKGLPVSGSTTHIFENDQGYVPGHYFNNNRVMRWYGDHAKFIVGNLFMGR